MTQKKITLENLAEYPERTFGHDMLRYIGLPALLGREKEALIYFYGRNLARHFAIETEEDLQSIFQKLQWGQLELVKQKRNTLLYYLMSDELAERIDSPLKIDFRMEAGFLAECIEQLYQRKCECSETFNKRLYRAEFNLTFID